LKEEQQPALTALCQFLNRVGLAYTVEDDILHALWGKFLLNVGINQACMVYETTYAGALNTPHIFATMSAAMHEVITIAEKEGIHLTEQDFEQYITVLRTLKPDGYPSMRQDAWPGECPRWNSLLAPSSNWLPNIRFQLQRTPSFTSGFKSWKQGIQSGIIPEKMFSFPCPLCKIT